MPAAVLQSLPRRAAVLQSLPQRPGASDEQKVLRREAQAARDEWREGRKLERRVHAGTMDYNDLKERQQRLVDEFLSHALHKKVDMANLAYGHGVARTNDYGFAEGEQICQTLTLTQRTSAILKLSVGRSNN